MAYRLSIDQNGRLFIGCLEEAEFKNTSMQYHRHTVLEGDHTGIDLSAEESMQTVGPPGIKHDDLEIPLLANREQPLLVRFFLAGLLYTGDLLTMVADSAVHRLHLIDAIEYNRSSICSHSQ